MKNIFSIRSQWKILLLSSQSIVVIFFILSLAGCSGFSDRERISEDDTVSREKYEQLKQKYEQLSYQLSEIPHEGEVLVSYDEDQMEAQEASTSSQLAETVDVFAQTQAPAQTSRPSSSRPVVQAGQVQHNYDDVDVDDLVTRLRKAVNDIDQQRYDAAMSELRSLESAPIRQISARARFYIGELFFAQEEYDLAMQAFEDILKRDAFSGLVIKTLNRLITCSENLDLQSKREQYHSLLHDFFES